MIFLQIIGAIVVAILVVIILVVLFFKFKYGNYLDAEVDLEPLIVHLNEDISPDWLKQPKAEQLVSALETLGYSAGQAYCIYEMDDVLLQPFYKDSKVAVVYSHNLAGCWVDIVMEETGKMEYTFSNAPMGAGLEQPPGCEKTVLPDASIAELDKLAEEILNNSDGDFLKVEAEEFRHYFEAAYKKDMAWKSRKGGISYEEFLRIEEETPFSSSKKNIEEAFVQRKLDELNSWHDAAMDEYRELKGIEEEDFWEIQARLLIVPFKSHGPAFLEYLEEREFLKEEQADKLTKAYSDESGIPELFEKINGLYSPELRAKLISETAFPLDLKIYQLSEGMVDPR